MSPLDQVADTMRRAFHARWNKREPPPWAETTVAAQCNYRDDVRAVLHGLQMLDDRTLANVWKRLKSDPCGYGATPDQATRALLDALAEELTS